MNISDHVKPFLKARLFLFLVIGIFIAFKIPYLHYPFFWDESWPYASAIKEMYRHGVSLSPAAMDPELSRGHPLFFHATAAMWMNMFGTSHTVIHSFALLIAVCVLIAIYEVGLRLFNIRVAVIALVMTATQMFFFVQSTFVLPELLVTLLCFLSVYLYVTERYWWTALCLSMLFFTKESGLIAGFVIGMDALINLPNKDVPLRTRLLKLVAIAIPCTLMLLFFLAQKNARGWYVFPLHSSLVEHDWKAFWYKLRMACIRDTFYQHLRWYEFVSLLVLCMVATIKTSNYKLLVVLLPVTCIYYFVNDTRAGRLLPPIPFFIVYILSIAAFVYTYRKTDILPGKRQGKLLALFCTFIFCFHCFSASTLYTYRYLQAAYIPALFLFAVLADVYISRSYRWLLYPTLGMILIVNLLSFKQSKDISDVEPAAFDGIKAQQSLVDYLEHTGAYDKIISCGSFMNSRHLKDPNTGFLSSQKTFSIVRYDIGDNTDYIVVDNVEPDGRYETIKKDSRFHQVYRFQSGPAWAEVYGRN